MPKQQKKRKKCSMENIFRFLLRMDIQLIWEKNKYGKIHKRLVELIVIG